MPQTHLFEPAGWEREHVIGNSLPEVYKSIPIPKHYSFWRKLLVFAGPGFLVAVGYMDPGNWATDLAGGSKFGYALLSVILLSNFFAMLLQHLSLKLGIVTGKDLAQMCRREYSKRTAVFLWLMAEVMIMACDLAEVLGSAIALNLLFGIPILVGVIITAFDVLIILLLQNKGFRYIEAVVITLIGTITLAFVAEILLSAPSLGPLFAGFLPTAQLAFNPEMLYIAIGILALPFLGIFIVPRLHDGGMQIQIVRHHRRAENTNGDVEHLWIKS